MKQKKDFKLYYLFYRTSFSLLIVVLIGCNNLKITKNTDYSELLDNPKVLVTKQTLINGKEGLSKFHPDPFYRVSEHQFDSLITIYADNLPKDSVLATESVFLCRKIWDLANLSDPHVVLLPILFQKQGVKMKEKHFLIWPFEVLCINDTLLVNHSFTPHLKKGDRILRVNNTDAEDYLKYSYRNRFMDPMVLIAQNHWNFSPVYKVCYQRGDQIEEIELDGIAYTVYKELRNNLFLPHIFEEEKIGYFPIKEFKYNKQIIKNLKAFITKAKKGECRDIIIDIRQNPGGSGDLFDELLSLLTDKDSVPYLKNLWVKASSITKDDYDFNEDIMGELVELPKSKIVHDVPLKKNLFMGKINYYVLISKNTGSIAASFANILQYNNIGILVGESLKDCALRCGEISDGTYGKARFIISTTLTEENTKTVDDILYPDISIPFIASEYMQGGDPVLEKLLDYIKNKNSATTAQNEQN